MRIYSVHEPPLRGPDPLPDAECFIFVRDGFYFRAFLFAPLWMIWHGMWLVLAGTVIVSAVVETALVALGASAAGISIVALLISLLVGLEASTLRRFTLNRRGWRNVGIISGDDLEDAERRFFATWVHELPSARVTPTAAPPAAPEPEAAAAPRLPQGSEVIGLFPAPGARQ